MHILLLCILGLGVFSIGQSGVEDFNRPAQTPDLNLTQHLWDELKYQLCAKPYYLTSVTDQADANCG